MNVKYNKITLNKLKRGVVISPIILWLGDGKRSNKEKALHGTGAKNATRVKNVIIIVPQWVFQ
ncbi:MAG: hypothetical protein K2L04_07305 [Alistipes sp.]|nr:hypothetical protein [Alistipes sp.]